MLNSICLPVPTIDSTESILCQKQAAAASALGLCSFTLIMAKQRPTAAFLQSFSPAAPRIAYVTACGAVPSCSIRPCQLVVMCNSFSSPPACFRDLIKAPHVIAQGSRGTCGLETATGNLDCQKKNPFNASKPGTYPRDWGQRPAGATKPHQVKVST